eukprot:GHVL01024680.1.p1 GENE.GHVL01024680.1~~GHVL01024680.1.p1  ORF type:complete len:206 (-),score=64.89 GHVL01024680.1:55-672(-)
MKKLTLNVINENRTHKKLLDLRFDADSRREFVGGFAKRKAQRRKRAKDLESAKRKTESKEIKKQKLELIDSQWRQLKEGQKAAAADINKIAQKGLSDAQKQRYITAYGDDAMTARDPVEDPVEDKEDRSESDSDWTVNFENVTVQVSTQLPTFEVEEKKIIKNEIIKNEICKEHRKKYRGTPKMNKKGNKNFKKNQKKINNTKKK